MHTGRVIDVFPSCVHGSEGYVCTYLGPVGKTELVNTFVENI